MGSGWSGNGEQMGWKWGAGVLKWGVDCLDNGERVVWLDNGERVVWISGSKVSTVIVPVYVRPRKFNKKLAHSQLYVLSVGVSK
jgi:hypothetical protein